jgi:hypothetical protein
MPVVSLDMSDAMELAEVLVRSANGGARRPVEVFVAWDGVSLCETAGLTCPGSRGDSAP